MVKQPAVIIIVRHGARLDAADKSWHLSSPAPYDPPLTYGGWTQSRALGIRIASLLHQRDQALKPRNNSTTSIKEEDENAGQDDGPRRKSSQDQSETRQKKPKIYIHSSPFQRCVQTSVGISAGLEQFQGSVTDDRVRSNSKPRMVRDMHCSSPRLHAVDAGRLKSLDPLTDLKSRSSRDSVRKSLKDHSKRSNTTLRIDAFLGEWLSPDYFDLITPPPNSSLMVAGAKAGLFTKGDNIDAFISSATGAKGNLWGAAREQPTGAANGPLDDWKHFDKAIPRRDRTASYSSVGSSTSGRISPFRPHVNTANKTEPSAGYVPPTPSYAVSPIEPIPKGYVAHARDACVNVDYHWDSMRDPHMWGDGGQYGEEWSAMHKRFRRGLNHMIKWYDEDGEHMDDHEAVPEASQHEHGEEDDDEAELVVILVTHGAGCNALIGALTDQPVLLDVGMASLTMAVLKDGIPSANGKPASPQPEAIPDNGRPGLENARRESLNLGLSNYYDIKIVASSDHLRPGVDPAKPASPIITSHMSAAQTIPESRRRISSLSHVAAGAPIDANWNIGEVSRSSMSTALGSIRRGSVNVQPIRTNSLSSNPRGSIGGPDAPSMPSPTGLWSRATPPLPQDEFQQSLKDGSSHDLTESPSESRPTTSGSNPLGITDGTSLLSQNHTPDPATPDYASSVDGAAVETKDKVGALPQVGSQLPSGLGRTLSQKGLWGSAPQGGVARDKGPKRRWTVLQD